MILKKRKITFFDVMMNLIFLVFVAGGILTIIFSQEKFERDNTYLGIFIIVSALPAIVAYFAFRSYQNIKKTPAIVFSSMSLLLGVICIVAQELTIDHICILWGVLTLISCAYYLFESIGGVKKSKLEILSIIITIGEIVFGILLVINLDDGVTGHLIFMGISFILKGIKVLVQYLHFLKNEQ